MTAGVERGWVCLGLTVVWMLDHRVLSSASVRVVPAADLEPPDDDPLLSRRPTHGSENQEVKLAKL